ncbi:type III effector protein, partial [Streptomyces sp. NPDC031705]
MNAARKPASEQQPGPAPAQPGPATFFAAAGALEAIRAAVDEAHSAGSGTPPGPADGPHHALAALQLLREVRTELAGWESGLIETARAAGASWADLAGPLGVASRQAAERRYLRVRPGAAETTGEQRVQAVRDRRAAERSVTAWARENAGALRQLAGQIIGLTDLPAASDGRIGELNAALGSQDAARLVEPLSATHRDLHAGHGDLAERVDAIREHTRRLRDDSDK